MNNKCFVTFEEYWNSCFCWSDLDFHKNYKRIKNHYYKDYVEYCKHIGQEPEEINDYVLIDCGLIHKYCIKINDIKIIEDTTLYTVKVLRNLSNYKVELINNKMVFSNGSEKLVFTKVETSGELQWMLIE